MTDLFRVEREGAVHIVHMQCGENLVHLPFLEELNEILTRLEREPGPAALVITGQGKYYSTGFDRSALADTERAADIVEQSVQLCRRLLSLDMPTCAAINGHAFGIGGMIALCHDLRVMRSDRGFVCFPELALGFPLHPGMFALLKLRIDPITLQELLLEGTRVPGTRALTLRMVHEALHESQVLPRAIERARGLARYRGPLLRNYKQHLNAAALDVMERPSSFRFPPIPPQDTLPSAG